MSQKSGNDGGAADAIRRLRPSSDDLIPAEQRGGIKRRTRQGAWWVDPYEVEPPASFRIVVDTREQRPLFEAALAPADYSLERPAEFQVERRTPQPLPPGSRFALRGTLQTGDYSLLGFETRAAIERKSLEDLYGSCTSGRDRFKREFERLATFERAALLIEGTYHDILHPDASHPHWHSQAEPVSIEGTVFSWCARYGVELLFSSHNRILAERLAFRWLSQWWIEKAGAQP